MDKIKKMHKLVQEWQKLSSESVSAMFGSTQESGEAFEKMWDYAKRNGFVNPITGTITDCPVIKIYANHGVLSREKETVYTYSNKKSEFFDEIYIEIPESFKVYNQEGGTEIILSADGGYDYTVDELLKNVGDSPAFSYIGKNGVYHTIKCKVLEEI